MRKSSILLIFAAAFALSCSKEVPAVSDFSGSIVAIGNETKTVLGTGNVVKWSSGDAVCINGANFTANPGTDETTATFTRVSASDPTKDGGKYKAYFPGTIYNGGTPALPASQTYTDGRIGNAPMYAESTNCHLDFHNICALIALTLKGSDTVSSIEVSNTDNALCGSISITDNVASVTDAMSASNCKVTLDCGDGVALDSGGKTFYIAIPEGQHKLTFTITKSDSSTWVKSVGFLVNYYANTLYSYTLTVE